MYRRRYSRKSLAEYINGAIGLEVSFYQYANYWSVDIKSPFSSSKLRLSTKSTTLNPAEGRAWWVKSIKTTLASYDPEALKYVRDYEVEMWAKFPQTAAVFNIPKPETEECEMSTQTETKTEGKPALNRYRFKVVETFEIYVDAADEEAAKAFIEEGVPQMQHAAFQCHERVYTVKACEPLVEDKSCEKPCRDPEPALTRDLRVLKYVLTKRNLYMSNGYVLPRYRKQYEYWQACLRRRVAKFQTDFGYVPKIVREQMQERGVRSACDSGWDY